MLSTNALLNELLAFSSCTLANAVELLSLRLRNEGYTNGSIQLLTGQEKPIIGHAATVKIRCSSPPTAGAGYVESTQWWNYVLSVPEPRIVVIQDIDPLPGSGALIGEVHANILHALGCVGVITNGTVRDIPRVKANGFYLFAKSPIVSHAYSHIVEVGGPVEVAGLQIASGDLLHGDFHGVLSLPPQALGELPATARKMLLQEQQISALCKTRPFSVEALREKIRELREMNL